MASYNWNWPALTVNSGPVEFIYNGVATQVLEDTVTPANSRPLPVTILDPSGTGLDTNFGVVGAHTLRTAAEIGNATGAANFGAGATGAQTLRTQANQGAAGTLANGWPVMPTDGTNQQSFTGAGEAKVDVTQPLPAGTNIIGKVGIDQTTPGTTNGVQVVAALPAGTNVIGHVITDTGSTTAVSNFPATQPVSGTVTANQGTANTAANAWPAKITDGTNVTAVKAASTAPIATDPAAVVAISPNTPAIATKSPVNATGTLNQITNLTNVAQTLTAPAGAVGFLLEALSDNTANLRWAIGSTATTTSGMRLEPGRDSGFLPIGANISVICETAATNQVVSVQWVGP